MREKKLRFYIVNDKYVVATSFSRFLTNVYLFCDFDIDIDSIREITESEYFDLFANEDDLFLVSHTFKNSQL